jgi:hypothetical protein
VGKLCHAILKVDQGIRGDEDHKLAAWGAIGQIVYFLASFADDYGWDFTTIVRVTVSKVLGRDWVKNKKNGNEQDVESDIPTPEEVEK